MTKLQPLELTCPVCETRFRSQVVVSTKCLGAKCTDFRDRAAGTPPLPYLVHMCLQCGYAGATGDFTEEVEITTELRQHVWSELSPAARRTPIAGSEKYEAAARVAEWQEAGARQIADLLLRAAWCCVDEGDSEAERYFRRKAAWAFEAALGGWDGVPREERAVITYLIGELWRRIGDDARGAEWFECVPGEIVDWSAQQWVIDAARQQRDDPREWFGAK